MTEESIEIQGYRKLQEMLDRGWVIRLSAQRSSNTWAVFAAINSYEFESDRGQIIATDGVHKTLLLALTVIESRLARWAIENILEKMEYRDSGQKKDELRKIQELQPIADRAPTSLNTIGRTLINPPQ